MRVTHTRRMHPFSVHMSHAEAAELLEELADVAALLAPDEFPTLAAVRTKLATLLKEDDE